MMRLKTVFSLVIVLLVGTIAFGFVDDSGTLILAGTVPPFVSITVTSAGVIENEALDLVNGEEGLIAEVSWLANLGYEITVTSINNGLLKKGTDSITYTLKWNTTPITFGSIPFIATSDLSGGSGSANINIIVPPSGDAPEGNYTDTVTFTIASTQ